MPIQLDPEGYESAAFDAVCPNLAGLRVLEVGCGDGRLTRRYADRADSVLAIDPDEAAVASFADTMPHALRDQVELRVSRLDELAVPAGFFDLVLLSRSL